MEKITESITEGVLSVLGKGSYGKLLHNGIYKKITEYVTSQHKGAVCSNIVKTKDGWSAVITCDGRNILLYITRKDNGDLDFWEKDI